VLPQWVQNRGRIVRFPAASETTTPVEVKLGRTTVPFGECLAIATCLYLGIQMCGLDPPFAPYTLSYSPKVPFLGPVGSSLGALEETDHGSTSALMDSHPELEVAGVFSHRSRLEFRECPSLRLAF
jgi:hypothetical protein